MFIKTLILELKDVMADVLDRLASKVTRQMAGVILLVATVMVVETAVLVGTAVVLYWLVWGLPR